MKLLVLLGAIRETAHIVIDLKQTTIKLKDGTTPTPNEITVKIGEGNLTYSENRNIEYILDRGLLDEVRTGDEVPIDVTFDFVWEFIEGNTSTSTNLPTLEDFLKGKNNAALFVSTDIDNCRPFAVDLELDHTPQCGAGAQPDKEVITFPDFRYDTLDHDLRAGTIAVTGRCNATEATAVRTTQPSV